MYANNNVSESLFGSLIENIIKYSIISLSYTGAMLQSKRNRDFAKELVYSRRKKADLG